MQLKQVTQNCVFVTDDAEDKYCFSYEHLVAAIIEGKYIEYPGEKHYSVTSNQHKAQFRAYYNIKREN